MAIPIRDARIDVYQGRDLEPTVRRDPDFTIGSGELTNVQIGARVSEVMDEASFSIDDASRHYREGHHLQQGDRLVFVAPLGGGESAYGSGVYGAGFYGSSNTITWTGRVTGIDNARPEESNASLEVDARDFPADILSNRKITNSYVNEDVGAIIKDICRRKAPEIDRSGITDLGVTTDVKYSSADCWDSVLSLAARADAVTIPVGRALHVESINNLGYSFALKDSDLIYPLKVQRDDDIKNIVRIDSGENRKLEESQPVVDETSYYRVTNTDRITYRLRARKSEVHSIELYLRLSEADDSITVRLQSDENGAPIDIDDQDSDIVSARWQPADLEDGWNTFFLDDHVLADRDPWLIVESGETGHDVGRSVTPELAYRSYYPHPLNFEVASNESIADYGMREVRIEKANLKTLTAARDAARAELARRAWPSQSVTIEARSPRAHGLFPGRRVDINRPQDDVVGEYIITETDREWDAGSTTLQTTLVAEWRRGILDPDV